MRLGLWCVAFLCSVIGACGQDPSFTETTDKRQTGDGTADANGIKAEATGQTIGSDEPPPPPPASPTNGNPAPKGETEGVPPTTTEQNSPGDPSNEEIIEQIRTRSTQTINVDTFFLADVRAIHDEVDNSAEPLKRASLDQTLPAPRALTKEVLARSTYTKSFQKRPPLRYLQNHLTEAGGKSVDLFVTVDDSESFTAASIERTRTAVKRLVARLYDTNWVLFVGGLEGVGGGYDKRKIAKGTLTLPEAYAEIDNALSAIFNEASLGDERVFRSLNRLITDYAAQDRDEATQVYLIITDAPNCKDRFNAESATCTRSAGNNDHHLFLLNANASRPAYMRHMALFGAYYRMTDNPAVCGNADMIEAPHAGESLLGNSQYADLAARWEGLLFQGGATASAASWTGDLCALTQSLTWLDDLTDAARRVATYRFRITNQPDVFAVDPSYDLKVLTSSDAAVAPAQYAVVQTRVVILSQLLSGTYKAQYHQLNDYRKTDYPGLLDPQPEANTVTLTWAGGSTECPAAASFNDVGASVVCRQNGKDLFLRHVDFLPTVTPGQAPLGVTVTYQNIVESVRELAFGASTAIIPASIVLTAYPAAANSLVLGASVAATNASGTTYKIAFSGDLPPGSYRVEYLENAQTAGTKTLPGRSSGDVLCYLPDAAQATGEDSAGNLFVTPATATYPCNLDAAAEKVGFAGLVPAGSNGRRSLGILYHGYVEPIAQVALSYPPYGNIVALKRDGMPVPSAQYEVENNLVELRVALAPGQNLALDYEFRPPLPRCFVLSGHAFGAYPYRIWYGKPGDVAELKTDFTLETPADGFPTVCLNDGVEAHGKRLIVGYVSNED